MKKLSKYIVLSLVLSISLANIFIQNAHSECIVLPPNSENYTFNYKYSMSDHLRTLERYSRSIEKFPENIRWKFVPENIVMVYLWDKENYHDDEMVPLTEKWINLSKKVHSGNFSEYAKFTNIIANLLRQNYSEAEATYRKLNTKENPYLSEIAKTLIGTTKKTKASLQGNTFIYDIRVTSIEDARNLVSNWPDSALARYILAIVLKNKEEQNANNEQKEPNFSEAFSEINKATELAPNNLLYSVKKIGMTYEEKNSSEIDGQFNTIFKESLKDTHVAEEIANFYARNKQINKAVGYLTEAVKADKSRFNLYRKLNSLYTYSENYLPIIEIYENLIKENPQRVELYGDLAELYQKSKSDYKNIVNLFKKAIEANPDNSDMHFSLGDAYFYDKNPDKAAEEYLSAVKLNDNNLDAYGKLIGIYWDKNESENVIKYSREAIKNNPDYAMGYLWIGSVLLKQNKQEEAINSIRESLKINPKFITGYNSLGLAYRAAKKFDLALEQFNRALELNPNNLEALLNIGDTYSLKGDYEMAEKTYTTALVSDPYNEGIYFSIGNLYTESKDFKKAETAFQKAILLNPFSLDSRNNLGNVYLKQNKLDDAIDEFEKVLDINDKYATAYYNIACALSLKKLTGNSLKFLETAIQMDSSLKEIARKDPDFNNIKEENKFKELTN